LAEHVDGDAFIDAELAVDYSETHAFECQVFDHRVLRWLTGVSLCLSYAHETPALRPVANPFYLRVVTPF
jgi:hypothetical protein